MQEDDERELLNYRNAFELVSDCLGSGEPIVEGLIREIHKLLVRSVRGEAAIPGEYRHVQNYIVNSITREVIYTPPPALDVPRLMADLAKWLRGRNWEFIRFWWRGSRNLSRWTFIHFSTETAERPGCFRRCVPDGLRFQTIVHDQRVLRPESAGIFTGRCRAPGNRISI